MIQIEGTSPPGTNDEKTENKNESSMLDVSNKIKKIIGQQSISTNDDNQTKEDSSFQQNSKINSEPPQINNEASNTIIDVETGLLAIKKSNSNEESKNTDGEKNNQTNNNNDVQEGEDKSKLDYTNNNEIDVKNKNEIENINKNSENTNDNNDNNDNNGNNENKNNINESNENANDNNENTNGNNENTNGNNESTNENNESTNEDNESTNENNENNKYIKIENGENDYKSTSPNNDENEDNKNGNPTIETNLNNNDDNDNQNNEEETQQHINANDTETPPLNTDRSNNSNTSSRNPLLNKPFSFYMTHADPKEVEDSLNSLMVHNTQPIEQLRDPVMQLINRKKLDALIDRDYDLAEKYDQTAELLQQSGDDILFERNERIRKLTLDDRADTISEKKNSIQQKYNTKIEDLKNERKSALENLQAQQENENIAFRQKWQDPNFISKYKRPSPELIQLRYVEKKLALSKFYDEAKEKKMWADKQQKIEEKQTQIIIEEEMKKEFFRMKDDQLFQLKKVSDHYDNLIRSLEFQRNKEVQSMDYALKQMEVKKNTVPNRKLHTIPKELSQMNEKYTDTSLTAKMSPRTLSKLAKFRIEKKGKINVSPISDSTFSKLIAAHPIVRPQSKFKVNNHPPSRLRRL